MPDPGLSRQGARSTESTGVDAGRARELGLAPDAVRQDVGGLGEADARALRALGVDLDAVWPRAEAAFGPGALRPRPRLRRAGVLRRRRLAVERRHLPFSESAKRALQMSLRAALALRSRSIGAEHVLLGLLAEDTTPAALTLSRLGTAPGSVRVRLMTSLRQAA